MQHRFRIVAPDLKSAAGGASQRAPGGATLLAHEVLASEKKAITRMRTSRMIPAMKLRGWPWGAAPRPHANLQLGYHFGRPFSHTSGLTVNKCSPPFPSIGAVIRGATPSLAPPSRTSVIAHRHASPPPPLPAPQLLPALPCPALHCRQPHPHTPHCPPGTLPPCASLRLPAPSTPPPRGHAPVARVVALSIVRASRR